MSSLVGQEAVLVVDDERASTDLIRITLGMDHEVFTANDGEAALDTLAQHPQIALAIIDQRMPRMTGSELIQKTIEPYPELIRVILTGHADVESVIQAINAGHVYRYLTKPWHREELIGVIRQGLEMHRLARVQNVLNKVVSKEIADEILRKPLTLGGEERSISVLFADIRSFTSLTRNLPPAATVEMLNGCMTVVANVVDGHGGVIDKFIGDAVMALFGAPLHYDDHGLRSVRCGVGIMEAVAAWNAQRPKELPAVSFGIGIHSGLVVAGNMGAQDRLNYTVVGTNVNLASRICGLAGPEEILVSAATLGAPGVRSAVHASPRDPVQPKGFDDPVELFRVDALP